MSKLQELIQKLCPDGVEYKTLGETGTFLRGSSFQKKDFVDDGVPCIHYGQVHTQFDIATEVVISHLEEGFAARMKRAEPGDLIIATTAEDDDAVGKAIAWLGDTDVVVSNDAYIFQHELDPKYMAYVFASDLFQTAKRQHITGTKVRRLNEKGMSKIVIPVPPIEIQREVVRILDEYTAAHNELIKQLEEEMELREQQLAIARNELLTFAERERVRWATLGEIGELVKGSGLQKKDFSESGVGCIHYGQIHTRFGTFTSEVVSYVPEELASRLLVVHPGDVVVAVTSEDVSACCKAVAWIGDEDVVTGGHSVVIRHSLNPKYLSYCFQTKEFYDQKKKYAAGVKVVEMRTDKLSRIRIPVPPIEDQNEVVRILDEYTAANDDLRRQLSVDMQACEEQLALVRNQILSFPEKAA